MASEDLLLALEDEESDDQFGSELNIDLTYFMLKLVADKFQILTWCRTQLRSRVKKPSLTKDRARLQNLLTIGYSLCPKAAS